MGRASGIAAHQNSRRRTVTEQNETDRIVAGVRRLGFTHAYMVGGCERDRILGRPFKDIDFAIAGHSQQELLARARAAGSVGELRVAGQLIGVRLKASWTPPDGIEIALARTEVATGGGRHAFAIRTHPDVTIEEDLARRDFTCNALARCIYTGELIDPYDGVADIRAGVLRTVSPRSFPEDPLRVLRGLARCAKDGCYPDPLTFAQMREWADDPKRYLRDSAGQLLRDYVQKLRAALAEGKISDTAFASDSVIAGLRQHNLWGAAGPPEGAATDEFARQALDSPAFALEAAPAESPATPVREALTGYRWYGEVPLSPERVYEELQKILAGDGAADALRLARDSGILPHLLPELEASIGFAQLSKYHDMSVDEHTLRVLEHACKHEASMAVRLAALLHDNAKPQTAWGWVLNDAGVQRAVPSAVFAQTPMERKLPGAENLHFYARPPDPLGEDAGAVGGRSHEALGAERARAAMNRFASASGGNTAMTAKVVLLVAEHMYSDDEGFGELSPAARARRVRRFVHRVGRDNVEELLLLRRCDRAGKRLADPPPGWDRELAAFETSAREQMDAPMNVRELAVNGHQLMELGFKGAEIGAVQRMLLERVLEDPVGNRPEQLLHWAREYAAAQIPNPGAEC